MKKGESKRIIHRFAQLLPPPWKLVGSELMRQEGDWVQILSLNTSRFSDQYVPRSCLEFLKMPGPPTGSFLVQELQTPKGAQRWVNASEAAEPILVEMSDQFRPSLVSPLRSQVIHDLLEASSPYWPHFYALCIVSAEANDRESATKYLEEFERATAGKPFPWADARRAELVQCLKLAASPEALRPHLEGIKRQKLRALRLVT